MKTILTQMEILAESRTVIAHFVVVFLDAEGNEQARSRPHTVSMTPDAGPASVLAAINADITTRPGMLWPEILEADWARVTAHCGIEHTPEIVAAYVTFKEAQQGAE